MELSILEQSELRRAASLVGLKNKKGQLDGLSNSELIEVIESKTNPEKRPWEEQLDRTLMFYELNEELGKESQEKRHVLYLKSCELIEKYLSKLSKKKRKKIADALENELEDSTLSKLRSGSRVAAAAGGGVLLIQGGAIAITGSNLGIALLMTQGLSGISSLIGVTFPFAAYMGAGIVAGKILGIASFLANPWIAVPVLGIALYQAYRKRSNRQYVNYAGVNYLCEVKRSIVNSDS